MKKLSFEQMEQINGGGSWVGDALRWCGRAVVNAA